MIIYYLFIFIYFQIRDVFMKTDNFMKGEVIKWLSFTEEEI